MGLICDCSCWGMVIACVETVGGIGKRMYRKGERQNESNQRSSKQTLRIEQQELSAVGWLEST